MSAAKGRTAISTRLHFNILRPSENMSHLVKQEMAEDVPTYDVSDETSPFAYLHGAFRGDEPDEETGEVTAWDPSQMGHYDADAQVWRFPEDIGPTMGIATKTRRRTSTRSAISPPTASYQGESPDYGTDDSGYRYVTDDACF